MIQNLFTIPIYNTVLNIDNKRLETLAYQEKEKDKEGRILSNTGYQTKDLDFDPYKFLFDEISKHVKIFYEAFSIIVNNHYFDNFWITINDKNDLNRLHAHAKEGVEGNYLISGTYYIKVPKDSGEIVFVNPNLDIGKTFNESSLKEYNSYNSSLWAIMPEVGQLLLFPATLKHAVETNKTNENRICLSFNVGSDQRYHRKV